MHNTFRDNNGNVLLLDIEIEKHRITMVNLYGPNKDDPNFYEELNNTVLKYGNRDIIMMGDWNLLLNPAIDGKNYKHVNNPNAREKVFKLINDLNLYDVWREENTEKHLYTWKRKVQPGIIQMGRLDFFLVSETLIQFSHDEDISHGYRSDHSLISLSLQFNKSPQGKTFWKFNSSLLNNIEFVKEVKEVILSVKKQYAASPYNLDNIEQVPNSIFEPTITRNFSLMFYYLK